MLELVLYVFLCIFHVYFLVFLWIWLSLPVLLIACIHSFLCDYPVFSGMLNAVLVHIPMCHVDSCSSVFQCQSIKIVLKFFTTLLSTILSRYNRFDAAGRVTWWAFAVIHNNSVFRWQGQTEVTVKKTDDQFSVQCISLCILHAINFNDNQHNQHTSCASGGGGGGGLNAGWCPCYVSCNW